MVSLGLLAGVGCLQVLGLSEPRELRPVGEGGAGGGRPTYKSMILDADPVVYFDFEEEQGSFFDAVHGLEAVPSGDVQHVASGVAGRAVAFAPKAGTRLEIIEPIGQGAGPPGYLDFAGEVPMSVEVWVATNDVSGFQGIVVKAMNEQGYSLGIQGMAGTDFGREVLFNRFDESSSTTRVARGPDGVTQLGVFHHIVVTFDGTKMRLWIDGIPGEETATASEVSIADTSFPLAIGSLNGTNVLDGQLDELAIYDRALSDSEIANHYAAAVP